MIILNTNTKSVEILLGAAVATNALPVVANWVDILTSDQSVSAFGGVDNTVTGTGAVTIVPVPAVGHTRTLKSCSIYNADTTGATVTARVNNGSSTRILVSILLATGSTLEYVE